MKIAQYLVCFGLFTLSGCSNACEEAFAKWNTNESTAAILLSTGKDDDARVANYSAKFAAEGKQEAESVCSADEYANRILIREVEILPERQRLIDIRELVKRAHD